MRVRKWLPLSTIRIDRLPLNRNTLDLVNFLRAGGEVPPIRIQKVSRFVQHYGGPRNRTITGHYEYHIKDGRRRWAAYKLLERDVIEVVYGESHA